MNILNLGFSNFCVMPDGHAIYIGATPPALPAARRAAVFDYRKHHYNPFKQIDYASATAFLSVVDASFPAGAATLTREAGLDAILRALLAPVPKGYVKSLANLIPLPKKSDPPGLHWAHQKISRILLSPALRAVLDPDRNQFDFSHDRTIIVKIDNGQLTDFDVRFLVRLMMVAYKGQIVLDDYGPYALPSDIDLLHQKRLICSVRELKQLPEEMRDQILYLSDITTSGVQYRDAVRLAEIAGYSPDPLREDNDYTKTIRKAMER